MSQFQNPNSIQHIKLYQIDRSFYEFKSLKSNEDCIKFIIEKHKEKHPFYSNNGIITKDVIGTFQYIFYTYRKEEIDSPWKAYFPAGFTESREFGVEDISFVLFIYTTETIYAIVGGKGNSVISRYENKFFGIDFYEKVADKINDTVISLETRGLIGNLIYDQNAFRTDQTLIDSLKIGRIPTKVNLRAANELASKLLRDITFDDSEGIVLEIGSSFFLKHKMSFQETIKYVQNIDWVWKNVESRPISRFERVVDKDFIDNCLLNTLVEKLRDDSVNFFVNKSSKRINKDYDFIHPQKVRLFYECDEFKLYKKGSSKAFYETNDRRSLLHEGLKYIYDYSSQFNFDDFKYFLLGVKVKSFKMGYEPIVAPFITHINSEITFKGEHYFYIDSQWYKVKGDFISEINKECLSILNANKLGDDFMPIKWNLENQNEDEFNLQFENLEDFIVMDKVLFQNIELCDLIKIEEDIVYLIHVKKGFNAKMRDLTNQISISANRLSNGASVDEAFLKGIFKALLAIGNKVKFTESEFLNIFRTHDIVYVSAFCPIRLNRSVYTNIEKFSSNIAKLSIVQCIREMQIFSFGMKVYEIEQEV